LALGPEKLTDSTLCCAVLCCFDPAWDGVGWVYASYFALLCRLWCCISKDGSCTPSRTYPTDISSRSGGAMPRCRASMTCLLRVTSCGDEEGGDAFHAFTARERETANMSLSPLEQDTYRSTRPTSRPRGIHRRLIQRRESKMQLSRLPLTCVRGQTCTTLGNSPRCTAPHHDLYHACDRRLVLHRR
jgi:hypothetical protein